MATVLQYARNVYFAYVLRFALLFAGAYDNIPLYYTCLFNGITDALEALQARDCVKAHDILIKVQQDAEELYLEDGDEGEA